MVTIEERPISLRVAHLNSLSRMNDNSPLLICHYLNKMEAIKATSRTTYNHSPIKKFKHCPACLMPFSYGNFTHTLKQPKSVNSKLRRMLRLQKERSLNSKERKKLKYLKKKSRNLVVECFFCKQESRFQLEINLPELDNENKESIKKKQINVKAKSAIGTGITNVGGHFRKNDMFPNNQRNGEWISAKKNARKNEKLKSILKGAGELKNSSLVRFLTGL